MADRRPAGAARIHYSQCWEDVAIARIALCIPAGGRVLAIGAAGDNVLALLADDPAEILAVDLSPAQTALLELKRAALTDLPADAVGPFLGAGPDARRLERYEALRSCLPASASSFWDSRSADVAAGVIHVGRFERFLAAFRRWVLPIAPGRATVGAMLAARDVAEQADIYRERWDSRRWRMLFRLFFSRRLLAAFGRHPAAFRYADVGDVGRHFLGRARVGLTATPIATNPYATYILTGGYTSTSLPEYLRPAAISLIRARARRVEVQTRSIQDALRGLADASIDAFYLSDVFELLDVDTYHAALDQIARVGRPGARICYWNNLVERTRPERLAGSIARHDELAARLLRVDRGFLYSRLVIESVTPRPARRQSGARRHAALRSREPSGVR